MRLKISEGSSLPHGTHYLVAVCCIAIVWFVVSNILTLKIISIEDPGWDSVETVSHIGGHTLYSIGPKDKGLDNNPSPSRWLNMVHKIVFFPSCLFDNVSKPFVLSDRENGWLFFGCEVLNSLFWGTAGVCFYEFVKMNLRANQGITNAN